MADEIAEAPAWLLEAIAERPVHHLTCSEHDPEPMTFAPCGAKIKGEECPVDCDCAECPVCLKRFNRHAFWRHPIEYWREKLGG